MCLSDDPEFASVFLINLTTFMLCIQRAPSKLPLGFFPIHFPSSIMDFISDDLEFVHWRLTNSVNFYILTVLIQVGLTMFT